ncbi:hypothetical protein [Bremerella sp.]|uniref:hypothetical protein n=1 Tax=Bremerella sp. TaxID=2795602 RepID=UPI003919FD5D
MQCKNGDQCPCKSAVRRQEAVEAICNRISQLILRDAELIKSILLQSQQLDAQADQGLEQQLARARKQLALLSNRVHDLFEMSGEGTEDDRKEIKARLRDAQSQRNAAQSEVNRLQRAVDGTTNRMTVEQIRERLAEMSDLLSTAANGDLGEDAVYKTLAVFRALTGGQIWVQVEQRANRKRTNVRGTFRPQLLQAFSEPLPGANAPTAELVAVWLRKPPRLDLIAERVHQLIDVEGMSHREAAKQLQREGHNVNSGNVWYSYRRWYEMQGLEPPNVPYNNGKKRRPR